MDEELYKKVFLAIKNQEKFSRTSNLSAIERSVKKGADTFRVFEDKLYFITVDKLSSSPMMLPVAKRGEVQEILCKVHIVDGIHGGMAEKLWRKIKTQFYTGRVCSGGIREIDCQEFIKRCQICQEANTKYNNKSSCMPILYNYPMERLQIDLKHMVDNPYNGNRYILYNFRYLLAVIDCFSKFLWLFALEKKEEQLIAESLITLFDKYGVGPPIYLQSDNGPEFVNSIITDLKNMYGLKIIHGKPYTPNHQGIVERQNQTLGAFLKKYQFHCQLSKIEFNWSDDLVLANICKSYNSNIHESIGITPYEAFYGRPRFDSQKVNGDTGGNFLK
jgi:hypothetical protein